MRFLAFLLLLLPAVAWGQNAQRLPPGVPCGSASPPSGVSPPYMDASGNLCTSGGAGTPSSSGITDRSGTITLGGTAQTLMAANASRRGCEVQNISAGDLWVNELGVAAVLSQPSRWLPPGAAWSCFPGVSAQAISIIGATTSQAFVAREW